MKNPIIRIPVADMDAMLETLRSKRNQLVDLCRLGACYLNGKEAHINPPDPGAKRVFWRVSTNDGSDSSVFTEQAVRLVVQYQGGRFRTRELRRHACC